MTHYNIIIIGAGISSLYFLWKYTQMVDKPQKILIMDKQGDVGGRIWTKTTKVKVNGKKTKYSYELGAGRFQKSHKNLMFLLDALNLSKKIVPNGRQSIIMVHDPGLIKWIVNQPKKLGITILSQKEDALQLKLESYTYIQRLFKKLSKNIDDRQLYQYSIMDLARNNLDTHQLLFLEHIFPYNGQLHLMNAYDFYNKCIEDYFSGRQYYSLKGGLSQVVKKLKRKVQKKVSIHLDEKCLQVFKDHQHYHIRSTKGKYTGDKIIFNISPSNAKDILGLPQYDVLDYIVPKPLYRIYAVYPKKKGKVWFDNIPRVLTNSPIRSIIPINKETGLIMISYTDYTYANQMNDIAEDGPIHLEAFIQDNLKMLFPKLDIPKPKMLDGYYWKKGVNYWMPSSSSLIYSNLEHLKRGHIYLMGEAYSDRQAWIEGGLRSAEMVLTDITQN